MSLEEMTIMVVQWQQAKIKELEWDVSHKQKQLYWAKWGHTKAKNKLKAELTEVKKKAEFYEKQTEEYKRVFWWQYT